MKKPVNDVELSVKHSPRQALKNFYKKRKVFVWIVTPLILLTIFAVYIQYNLLNTRGRAETILPGRYVAPNGTAQGDGTITSPWDLQTALHGASGRVKPGDTIWLRGGTYGNGGNTTFTSDMQGTEAAPIVVRQYPGERATVDGGIVASGSWTWYWGFEIMNSSTQRTGDSSTNFRPSGINMAGPPGNGRGNKVINMIIHDTGHPGIGFWKGVGNGGEIYGSLIWGAGIYDSKTTFNGGARGSPIYAQNQDGNRYIRDNITFRNFTTGMKAYTEGGYANGFVFDGNAIFDAGGGSNDWLLFVAAKTYPTNNVTIANNYIYRRPNDNERGVQIGYYSTLQGTATLQNNYIVNRGNSNGSFYGYNWTNINSSGNTFVSNNKVFNVNSTYSQSTYTSDNNKFYSPYATPFRKNSTEYSFPNWKSQTGLDLNSTFESSFPTENKIFVRPNKYEAGRANIIVYNWQKSNSVSVDISSAGLSSGASYKVMDAQNFYGAPVAQGVYDGNPISLPMNLTQVSQLIGDVTHINNTHTAPDFATFVLLPIGVNPTASEPTPPSTVTPTSPPTIVTQPINTPTPTPAITQSPSDTLIKNGGFESTEGWRFYSDVSGNSFSTTTDSVEGLKAGITTITNTGSNMQLYQSGITLMPNTKYRLTFSAKSNNGNDIKLSFLKHTSPYTNYGLNSSNAALNTSWQNYTFDFTTTGFTSAVSDARLMIKYSSVGTYYMDNVILISVLGSTPTPTSVSVTQPIYTSTPIPKPPTNTPTPVVVTQPIYTPTTAPTIPPSVSIMYEAESATLRGAGIATNHTGYTGTGFVDYKRRDNEYIEWRVNIPVPGLYRLRFRYANASKDRPLEIRLNGTLINTGLSFPSTPNWDTWDYTEMTANLNSGVNTIRATSIGKSGANIDHLQIVNY